MSSLITSAEQEGHITGLPITKSGFRLSHLFFADDSLLFCRATFSEWYTTHEILKVYERASGQKINWDKTSIFLSKNTKQEFRNHLFSILGISVSHGYEKYLGLPAIVGRAKIHTCSSIKGRVRAKLNGWKEQFLSQSEKELLLKAIIQAIPTYTMSVFQLPKSLCRDLNAMMNKIFWGYKENDHKMIWMRSGKMGLAKQHGVLACRDLECFNLALLAKQGWCLLHHPNSLVALIMKEKYYLQQGFLEATLGGCPSYAWRSIFKARSLSWKA